jgi:geranylgeranyl reductase family protein
VVPDSVVVVGAGPAGATAALALARAGVAVRLLDRSQFPRNKPCGGGISTRALTRFPHLERALARISTHWLSKLHLEGPDGESTEVESERPAALMIRRVEFDALLVSLAVEAGAELVTGADIVQASMDDAHVALVARDGRRFESPIVIAADGVHSVIGQRLGIRQGWPASAVALDMMEEAPRTVLRDRDPSTLWVEYGCNPPRGAGAGSSESSERASAAAHEGYAYIFPKRDHVNVGIGYVLQHYRDVIAEAPYELQRGLVDRLRARGIVDGESDRKHFTPFLIPVGGPLRRPGRGRVLLAGDAGGFVNALTAEGIYYAMVSGELAARAVIETPAHALRQLSARYRRACAEELGAELRESVFIRQTLFADRRRIARLIQGARTRPALTQKIIGVALGTVRYSDLRYQFLTRTPLFAARVMWERLRRWTKLPADLATTLRRTSGAR